MHLAWQHNQVGPQRRLDKNLAVITRRVDDDDIVAAEPFDRLDEAASSGARTRSTPCGLRPRATDEACHWYEDPCGSAVDDCRGIAVLGELAGENDRDRRLAAAAFRVGDCEDARTVALPAR